MWHWLDGKKWIGSGIWQRKRRRITFASIMWLATEIGCVLQRGRLGTCLFFLWQSVTYQAAAAAVARVSCFAPSPTTWRDVTLSRRSLNWPQQRPQRSPFEQKQHVDSSLLASYFIRSLQKVTCLLRALNNNNQKKRTFHYYRHVEVNLVLIVSTYS